MYDLRCRPVNWRRPFILCSSLFEWQVSTMNQPDSNDPFARTMHLFTVQITGLPQRLNAAITGIPISP
jgi:hypothetical protein